MPRQNKRKTPTLSIAEVLEAIKREKVSFCLPVGVQPTLHEYLTQMGKKVGKGDVRRGRSTYVREELIIPSLQKKVK